jgi:RHS repeat-associated protein
VNFTYLNQMLLDTVSGTNTYVNNTDYDAAGSVDLRNLGADVLRTDYVYYAWNTQGGRLQYLKTGTSSDPTSMQYFTYTYDEIGNVKTILDTKNSSQKQCFSYDTLDRLTRGTTQRDDPFCQGTPIGNGQYDESYAYDGTTGNLNSKGGQALSYGDTNHKHATTAWNGWTYTYDANGNMRTRMYGGTTYTLTYDAENRMTGMTGGSVIASFVYDGDGNRVKGIVGGITTTYVGSYFEWVSSTSDMKKYYYAGGVRVAMRSGSNNPLWLLGDHLGSTSKVANYNGLSEHSQQMYKPWGEKRYPTGAPTLPTTFRFTGQRSETGLGPSGGEGLYFYNSRWYDSYLNRWIQPDDIIPNPSNSQDLDRYAYVRNNPTRYVDPTGHWTEDELEEAFGKDWQTKYFGKDGVFYGREKLLKFLLSDKTTDPITLEIVRTFFSISADAHSTGLDFSTIDALGARFSFNYGAGGFVGGSLDVILNLNSGQISIFGSPEGGLSIGETGGLVGGITLLKHCPSNDYYRGTAKNVGIMGGPVVGINVEKFWGGVHRNQYPNEVSDGGFIGVMGGIPGIIGYGSLSFAYEGLRVDQAGYYFFPYIPGPIEVIFDIGDVLWNDILKLP